MPMRINRKKTLVRRTHAQSLPVSKRHGRRPASSRRAPTRGTSASRAHAQGRKAILTPSGELPTRRVSELPGNWREDQVLVSRVKDALARRLDQVLGKIAARDLQARRTGIPPACFRHQIGPGGVQVRSAGDTLVRAFLSEFRLLSANVGYGASWPRPSVHKEDLELLREVIDIELDRLTIPADGPRFDYVPGLGGYTG